MMLLPYLAINDGTGCVELVNNARTLAYIARPTVPRPAGSWMINETAACDQHSCAEFNEADYTWPADWDGNPAPWADPAIAASGEFFGLLLDGGSMTLEAGWSSRRRGGSVFDRQSYTPRLLTITGTIISSSNRGTAYGEEWLVRQLLGKNCAPGRRGVFDARVLKHCPDPAAPEFAGWVPYVAPPLPYGQWIDRVSGEVIAPAMWGSNEWGTPLLFDIVRPLIPGSDPCSDPADAQPFFADADTAMPLPDLGWRDLHRVRFLSLEDLDDEPMPLCEGKRVVITCEVLGEGTWWPDDERWSHWTLMSRAFDPETAKPIDWTNFTVTVDDPCGSCGVPCRCHDASLPAIGALPPILLPDCYRQPLVEVSVSTVTPALPWSVEAAMTVEITGGRWGLENVAVKVWEALDGIPDPATALGCRVYSQRQPCSVAQIAGIPSNTTLRIDGRRGRVLLDCAGSPERGSEDMVTGPDGHPFEHPRFSCGTRYWVQVTADWYHMSDDANVRIAYVPVEVS